MAPRSCPPRLPALVLACTAAAAALWPGTPFLRTQNGAVLRTSSRVPSGSCGPSPAAELRALAGAPRAPAWQDAVASAALLGLMLGLLSGPQAAGARPWPAEPDGMQSFRQHISRPLTTDLQRQDIQEARLPELKKEFAKDVSLKEAAKKSLNEAKQLRVARAREVIGKPAAEAQIPS